MNYKAIHVEKLFLNYAYNGKEIFEKMFMDAQKQNYRPSFFNKFLFHHYSIKEKLTEYLLRKRDFDKCGLHLSHT